jgi:two-component system, OmpR family, KDP operon response regulator KdpE
VHGKDTLAAGGRDPFYPIRHSMILKQIWGIGYLEQPHVLRVNISNLRRKIEEDASRPRYILTEPGVGYRLKADD